MTEYKCITCGRTLHAEVNIKRKRCYSCWSKKIRKINFQRSKSQEPILDFPIKKGVVFNVDIEDRVISSNVKHRVDFTENNWGDLGHYAGAMNFAINILINYIDPLLAYEIKDSFGSEFLNNYAQHNLIPSAKIISWLKELQNIDDINLRIKPEDCTN